MRIIVINGRAQLVTKNGLTDIATLSDGRFGPDVDGLYPQWDAFREWGALEAVGSDHVTPPADLTVGPPVSRPSQVFAIGLNYSDHAAESQYAKPDTPPVFTKFQACLTGPFEDLRLPTDFVDWEVELVVVMGRRAYQVKEADAWPYVAGLSVGQDYSERQVQMTGPAPQFSLGKSFVGFGPIGPWLVTPDEFENPDDLALHCAVDGEIVQSGRTSSLIFGVASLISHLSAVTVLHPGDIIFTGTPAGVGAGMDPPRFLRPGNVVVSRIEGVGEIRQRCVAVEAG